MDALKRMAAALEGLGLRLCADTDPIDDADDLAHRVEIACRNRAAGRKRQRSLPEFDNDGSDDPGLKAIRHNLRTDPDLRI